MVRLDPLFLDRDARPNGFWTVRQCRRHLKERIGEPVLAFFARLPHCCGCEQQGHREDGFRCWQGHGTRFVKAGNVSRARLRAAAAVQC